MRTKAIPFCKEKLWLELVVCILVIVKKFVIGENYKSGKSEPG